MTIRNPNPLIWSQPANPNPNPIPKAYGYADCWNPNTNEKQRVILVMLHVQFCGVTLPVGAEKAPSHLLAPIPKIEQIRWF